jgi:hypothetical protein
MNFNDHQRRLWQSMIDMISQYLERSSSDFYSLVGELEGALDASELKDAELVTQWYEYWGPLETWRATKAYEGKNVAYDDVKEELDAMLEFLCSIERKSQQG